MWFIYTYYSVLFHGPLTRYVKLQVAHAPGMPGMSSPAAVFKRNPLVSDPGMHHGTCVTHVPWCMSGSRTRGDGENVPGILRACAPAILRIWQEAHWHLSQHPCTSAIVVTLKPTPTANLVGPSLAQRVSCRLHVGPMCAQHALLSG